jgi:predicted nucleic acid-binding protein
MILADTSLWIDHLHSRNAAFAAALEWEQFVMHPFVTGELACGALRNRSEWLSLWAALPTAAVATDEEAMQFIERHRLMGQGLGYIDVHLLASAALGHGIRLWTRDAALGRVAHRLGLAYP